MQGQAGDWQGPALGTCPRSGAGDGQGQAGEGPGRQPGSCASCPTPVAGKDELPANTSRCCHLPPAPPAPMAAPHRALAGPTVAGSEPALWAAQDTSQALTPPASAKPPANRGRSLR